VIVETSHSLVAKDDTHRPYHPLARQLAGLAVAEIWHEIDRSWRAGMTDVHRTALPGLVAKYINHPQADPSWWTPTVRPALAAAERPVLRRGSRGERVRFLQRLLNDWLANPPGRAPLVLDGIFGPRTQAAVVAFQRRNGLPADGIVGSRTWNALQAPRLPGRH
jgi:murein L,D-transpeptidase YcbB/YkuD